MHCQSAQKTLKLIMKSNQGMKRKGGAVSFGRTTITITMVVFWVAIFYVYYFLFAGKDSPSGTTALLASGLICSLSALVVLFFLVEKKLGNWKAIALLILCVGADIGINKIIQEVLAVSDSRLLHYHVGLNLTLMGIALCGGTLLGGIIRKPSYLIPLTAAAGISDIWSVAFGVTHTIAQSRTAMNFLLFSFPVAGKGILPIIGVTDFVFAVMFLSLSDKFNMPIVRTRILIAASFIISITIAVIGGGGVPVLPVMGMFFIIGQYKYVKIVDPKEKRDAVLGILIIAAALAILTLMKYLS